jgi:ferredoxin
MAEVRAVVDHERCAGVQMCTVAAPGAFAINEDGLSEFQSGDWDQRDLTEAAQTCPMSAITVFNGDVEVT